MNKENKVTLCEKIKISKINSPVDNWSEFHKLYKLLQSETIRASNRVMSICNIYNSFDKKKDGDSWLEDNYNTIKFQKILYDVASSVCEKTFSKNVNSISNDIYRKYFKCKNSYKSKIDSASGNPPMTFTDSIPLYVVSQGGEIKCLDYSKGYYELDMPFLNKTWKKGITYVTGGKSKQEKQFNLLGSHIKFGVCIGRNKRQKEILDKIICGEYKLGDSKLQRVKKSGYGYEYYYLMSYTKPVSSKPELDIGNVLGVDVGITIPAYCAVNYCDYKRKALGDNTIIRQNLAQEQINRKMQKRITYNLRDGHGRKHKLDGYNGINNKIANRNKTYNFNLAREIINLAIKWNCGTIHLEKLTGFSSSKIENRFLQNWTYYDLQQKIENKAKENGIEVKYIDPYHTSQVCSKCGHWEEGQRLNQATFECKECGYKVNADYNAARNIAMSTKFVK